MMVEKPGSCQGCPWFFDGKGYVQDDTADTEVFVLQGVPDRYDEDLGTAMAGPSGKDLAYTFLPVAGLERGKSISIGSTTRCRGERLEVLPKDNIQTQAIGYCNDQYLKVPASARLIIVQGKEAFQFAHGGNLRDPQGKPASIHDWRGFVIPVEYTQARFGQVPVFVTLAMGDLHSNPAMESVTEWDWLKVRSILDGSYPKAIPGCTVLTGSDDEQMAQLGQWFSQADHARWITCDTEFYIGTQHLTILGLLARYADGRVEGLQVDWREARPRVREGIRVAYRALAQLKTFIFHNCRADIPVLELALGVTWEDYLQYEDTMLAHSVLWCELPHGLEFIASIWGQYEKLKHLKTDNEMLYNFGDVLETDSAWEYMTQESFAHDPQAEQVYRSQHLQLCPILERSIQRGLRINPTRVLSARAEYEAAVIAAQRLAEVATGWPINLNSPQQVAWYLYTIRGLSAQKNRKTGNLSMDDEAVATLRMELGPPFDPEEDLTYATALERIAAGADPLLEARVLYAGASTRLIKYIYCLYDSVAKVKSYNYPSKGAYEKAKDKAILAVKSGVDPVILDRIHPDMLIHSQKTGRWSTVDPPIAQLPADLRDVVCPDPGEVWISWDWSAIEPRILEGYCGSRILRRAFDEGIDLHTWTACAAFGYDYPPDLIDPHKNILCKPWREKYRWKGKDDPRRVFAKQARYEMYYGGTGTNAAASAALFGLDLKTLKRACAALISADPEYYTWRLDLEEKIKKARILRTFMGRPRRFLKGGHKMVREGLDQPMQGGVSDIANTTVILIDHETPSWFQFAWSMHDSQKWHCPRAAVTPELLHQVREWATREQCIMGRQIPFPIDLEIVYPPGEDVIVGMEGYTHH